MIKIKRPLLTVLIGMIIGIVYGLYLKTSIAITIILLILFLLLFQKNKSKIFYSILKRKKKILIILISFIISILYVFLLNNKYEKVYKEFPKKITTTAIIVSQPKETEYYYSFEVKVKNKKFIMYLEKNNTLNFQYGTKIKIEAEYTKPQEARNYKGFNYKEYLKTKKIYGSFKVNKIEIIKENNINIFMQYSNKIRNKIIETIKVILPEETEGLIIGILIGENSEISDQINENFRKSSLSHIVAISGSHITYIILGLSFILTKSKFPKKGIYILTINALILFMFITRFSPSVVRACIMGIIMLFSKVVYRKLDIFNSIAISLLIILINNPFAIRDVGLQLSYVGTLGILFLNNPIKNFFKKYINEKIAEIVSTTISAQIAILPITIINFNTISTMFIISNLFAVPLSGIITLYGYANTIIGMVSIEIGKVLGIILNILTKILIFIAEFTGNIPFATINIITPNIVLVCIYYVSIYIIYIKGIKKTILYLKNIIIIFYKKILISIILIIIIILNINSRTLKINFIDVGQRR